MHQLFRKSVLSALCAFPLLTLSACGDSEVDQGNAGGGGGGSNANELIVEAAQTYSKIVLASYEDSLELAEKLDVALKKLIEEPSEATLAAARKAWLDAREPYLQTEVYRFYNGPIDDEEGPEGLINAWPLDENYIDYTVDEPTAGIINDATQDITKEALSELNEAGGDANIATGYHAIEFLLWGQDLSADGPGDRPYTDYVSGDGGTAENAERRALYLTTVSELLKEHLESLVESWKDGDGDNYRAEFEDAEGRESLAKILTGMIILSGFETGGERLQTALDSGDQEDEHSCFSDNTHRDMIQDVQGVLNVYVGSYKRIDGSVVRGTSVYDVVASEDKALADRLKKEIEESLRLANALGVPFDQEIVPGNEEGNQRVRDLIKALRTQEKTLQDVFRKFGLTVPADPE